MRISDWSSDVCSSDLVADRPDPRFHSGARLARRPRHRPARPARGAALDPSTAMDRTPHRRRNRKRAPLKPCGHGVHPAAVGGAALYRLLGRADFVVALMASAMSALEWGAGSSPITVAPAKERKGTRLKTSPQCATRV